MAMEEEGRENIALQDSGGGDVKWIGELAIDIDPTRRVVIEDTDGINDRASLCFDLARNGITSTI